MILEPTSAEPASAELTLVEAPERLCDLGALLKTGTEQNHVLVHDRRAEPLARFWQRGTRRARAIVADGRRLRRVTYVAGRHFDAVALSALLLSFGELLAGGSLTLVGSPSCQSEVLSCVERVQARLSGVTFTAVFAHDATREEEARSGVHERVLPLARAERDVFVEEDAALSA